MICGRLAFIPIFEHILNKYIMNTVLLWMPGPGEMVVIALVFIVFFGAKKIPEIARGMGRGIREFKEASKEIRKEIESSPEDDQQKK
jgi:sec-independent protein translocase protein TatA